MSTFAVSVTHVLSTLALSHSGVIGGKFLERGRVKKPNQEVFKSEMSEYYMTPDLYVGARLAFNNFEFIITDADEYAFRYMEQHADEVGCLAFAICWKAVKAWSLQTSTWLDSRDSVRELCLLLNDLMPWLNMKQTFEELGVIQGAFTQNPSSFTVDF